MEHKDYILKAMQSMRGDDLERVRMSFANLSSAKMKEQFGQSGQTRSEVLKSYEEQRKCHDDAIAWLRNVAE